MKIINSIKNNMLGFIIGSIVFGGISYGVASQILATQVNYTNSKSVANVTNVEGALTELYGLAEECQNASSSGSGVTYYGKDAVAVYLDPTGNRNDCSSSNFKSDTETKEGCMRFYVYAEDGEYKYAILDHNTTANNISFYEAQSKVKEDTKTWNPNYQARNISAMEVYKITESTNSVTYWEVKNGNNFFFTKIYSSLSGQGYGWLIDRTYDCDKFGCETKDNNMIDGSGIGGYWVSDLRNRSEAWCVENQGALFGRTSRPACGVRPVIKIAK